MTVAGRGIPGARYRDRMSANPRPLHSVPTGPDVTAGSDPLEQQADVDPEEPTDTQALMQRIDRSGAAERLDDNAIEPSPGDGTESPTGS